MKKIVVYGKENCPNCVTLTNELKLKEIPYIYVDVVKDKEAHIMLINENCRSVPQIFVDGALYGSLQSLNTLIESYR